MRQHTKTPWRQYANMITSDAGDIAFTEVIDENDMSIPIANAAYIVRCVNSHAQLVDACEAILRGWELAQIPSLLPAQAKLLRKALAAASPESDIEHDRRLAGSAG